MSNYYDESVIEIMNSVNIFDVDVIRQLEEILTPQSSQRVSHEAKAQINQIASELKSFILIGMQESTTDDSEFKIENNSILCKMGIEQTSSQCQIFNGDHFVAKKSEPVLFRSEQSTKDKSRAYREKKKLRNEQAERLLGQKIALNLNLKRRIELLENARRILREAIDRKAQ